MAFNTLLVFAHPADTPSLVPLMDLMQLLPLPFTSRLQIFGMIVANSVLALLSERYAWPALASWFGNLRDGRKVPKIYKSIEREMRIIG